MKYINKYYKLLHLLESIGQSYNVTDGETHPEAVILFCDCNK